MGNTSGAKYKHIMYNVSRASQKSGKKLVKAIARFVSLIAKQNKQGETKWIYKTKEKAQARLTKYGVTEKMIDAALEKKGLKK
ncbi:MAG TPA: hypothetical protein PKC87_03670 [Candidatus Absconditabacterales bacterium]|nr:hypothetical protein [Candidatus Absconditabacterales bacterium]